jgi:hypothetical protein
MIAIRQRAAKDVRGTAAEELRNRVEKARAAGQKVLIVPLLFSYGGIED